MEKSYASKIKGGVTSLTDAVDGESCAKCGRSLAKEDVIAAGVLRGAAKDGSRLPIGFVGVKCPDCGEHLSVELLCGSATMAVIVLSAHQRFRPKPSADAEAQAGAS